MLHALSGLWAAMWPNVFAPSVFTVLGIAISHVKLKRHHVAEVQKLHDRLDSKGPNA